MAQRQSNKRNPLGGFIGLAIVLVLAYVLIKVVFGAVSIVWSMLAFVAPLLFILAMFFNFSVVKDYAKMLTNTFKKDAMRGLLYTGASFFGFPFVSLYLFFKAYNTRSKNKASEKKVKNQKDGEDYVEFEDVDSEDFLELPDIKEEGIKPKAKPLNRYDDLFSE